MSSAKGILLLMVVVVTLPVIDGWRWDFDWSTEEPANCPHNSTNTNVCSSLVSINATCVTFKCCNGFHDDEEYSEYDGSMVESEEENVYYFGRVSGCRVCFAVNPCSVYKCYSRCCDGYEEDHYGRCLNKTGHIQCQNGGTPRRTNYGDHCICPIGFTGKSCEIPICRCENGGECVVKDGRPYCNCSYGHDGERCELSKCHMTCQNGGICYRNDTYEYCNCPRYYVGTYCEHGFSQPDTCPSPDWNHMYNSYCASYCTSNSDCIDQYVCCKEGCTTVCRKKKVNYCVYNRRRYRFGESLKPDVCTDCKCWYNREISCVSESCAHIRCGDGRDPITKYGQCCHSCPGKPSRIPPRLYGCPTGVHRLNTSYYDELARIDKWNTHIWAMDSANVSLNVKFSPGNVRHCRCKDSSNALTAVRAYAEDRYGNTASCTFKVAVRDIYPPAFKTCPEDIYVFEKDLVSWSDPDFWDNVGVASKTCSEIKGKNYSHGDYEVTYQIEDFDKNFAFCRFHIYVTPEDADIESMPQGLRNRSKDKSRIALIVGPIIGGVFLVLAVVLILLCCRRRNVSRDTRGQDQAPPAYDSNNYAAPSDIDIKLPAYDDLPMNPPAYSFAGTQKDITYMSIAPPRYTNPGYEILKVQMSKPRSVKSNTSEKPEKESDV